jgi:Flp pilus assembly protein TadG
MRYLPLFLAFSLVMLVWAWPAGRCARSSPGSSTRSALSEPPAGVGAAEGGAAVVEFVLVSVVALVLAMSVAQLGLFLWERNALMGSLSEGARVAAAEGRTVADGRRVAAELLRRSAGARVADAVPIDGVEADGLVVLRAEGTLPSFVPGVPGLPVRMTARMHEEEAL